MIAAACSPAQKPIIYAHIPQQEISKEQKEQSAKEFYSSFYYDKACDDQIDIQSSYKPEPHCSEKFAIPIPLRSCPGSTIIEWKDDGSVKLNPDVLVFLDKICGEAYNYFFSFSKKKNLTPNNSEEPNINIVFLPWDVRVNGKEPRNLNDFSYRFLTIRHVYMADPRNPGFRGFNIIDKHLLFTPSNVIYDNFANTFVHEYYHALSAHYKTWNQNCTMPECDEIDEENAENFAGYFFQSKSDNLTEEELRRLLILKGR